MKHTFKNGSKLDVGFALNSDGESNTDILYSNAAGYKTFQYAWYHTNYDNLGISLLALNTGIEFLKATAEQEVNYYQTVGGRLTYKAGDFVMNGATYFQMGEINNSKIDINLSYYYIHLSSVWFSKKDNSVINLQSNFNKSKKSHILSL